MHFLKLHQKVHLYNRRKVILSLQFQYIIYILIVEMEDIELYRGEQRYMIYMTGNGSAEVYDISDRKTSTKLTDRKGE